MRLRRTLAVAVFALGLPGCSGEMDGQTLGGLPDSGGAPNGAGSGGMAGGAGTAPLAGGAQTTAGSSAGGTGQASGGSGSATPPPACSSFADDTAWKLTVHIKNQKSTTIYLGSQMMSCEAARLFEVTDGARAILPALESCRSSCTSVMTGAAVACPMACAAPSTITLAPGQSIDIPWDGLFGVDNTVPSECMHTAAPSPTACVRAQQIKNGLFTFTAQGGAERQCLTPGGCTTCTPNPSGGCTTPGSLMAGTITTTNFIIALDPGESSVGADPQYIGLVFKDQ
jgi:hypothetical protein